MTAHPDHVVASLNFAGFLGGLALYGMLLWLTLRAAVTASAVAAGPSSADPLPIATGVFGVIWNLGAIVVYGVSDLGVRPPPAIASVLAFTSLGFLPAVAVHSVVRAWPASAPGPLARAAVTVAYGLSATAGALHVASVAADGPDWSPAFGFRLLTVGFSVLILPLALLSGRQAGWRRALWVVGLALFAVSALHLSEHEGFDQPWLVELMGHHASMPLAVAILSQDYPFAFGDLLLKRALALGLVVVTALTGLLALTLLPLPVPVGTDRDDPVFVIGVLLLTVMTAVAYPFFRRLASWLVDAVILHRQDSRDVLAEVGRLAQESEAVTTLLDGVGRLLTGALSSRAVRWQMVDRADAGGLEPAIADALAAWDASSRTALVTTGADGRSAVVIVPASEGPVPAIRVGPLSGGRRLLSADVALLEGIAVVLARRLDALRLADERFERRYREQEISRLATVAELRALRAQINPHFLFNALTTIGYLIQSAPPRALQTLLRLTELLRRVLRSDGESTTLGAELDLVRAYLDIEHARFEDRLRVEIDVPDPLRQLSVPAFCLQPLVENAVKHGISPNRSGGTIRVTARLEPADGEPLPSTAAGTLLAASHDLVVSVFDSGAGLRGGQRQTQGERVGLANVERRLTLSYGARARLTFDSHPGEGTYVSVRMPADGSLATPDVAPVASGAAR